MMQNVSGTTWVQSMVLYLISQSTGTEVNQQANLEAAFSFLEFSHPNYPDQLQDAAEKPCPRLFKTHMPYDFLPADARKGKGKVQ
jgi:hypothetical protein